MHQNQKPSSVILDLSLDYDDENQSKHWSSERSGALFICYFPEVQANLL